MGDGRKEAFGVDFDRRLRLEFHGAKVTSDAGLMVYRELDEVAALTDTLADKLFDFRTGSNIQHSMLALIRQSLYSRLAGYHDTNDAERLSIDPAMRHVVGERAQERDAASTSQMGRFETDVLTYPDNLKALMDASGEWVDRLRQAKPPTRIVLDMDSSVSPTYGEQEGTRFNGHFGCTCYHPLFIFNQDGDVERAVLRNGNVHSAEDWQAVLEPVVARYREVDVPKFFRGDAAFAKPELYRFLEAEGYDYAIRLPANDTLSEHVAHLMVRPVGRPPKKPIVLYHDFTYGAASWKRNRRVVAKVEWHQGELFPRIGFVVTNLTRSAYRVVQFYNQRGIAEQWIKEGKHALHWTRLSCHGFDDNQIRLQLFVLAYNLGNFVRRLALPPRVGHWTLTTMLEKLIKIGARMVRHAGYVMFQMAEVAVPRVLFRDILARIRRLAQGSGGVIAQTGIVSRQEDRRAVRTAGELRVFSDWRHVLPRQERFRNVHAIWTHPGAGMIK